MWKMKMIRGVRRVDTVLATLEWIFVVMESWYGTSSRGCELIQYSISDETEERN